MSSRDAVVNDPQAIVDAYQLIDSMLEEQLHEQAQQSQVDDIIEKINEESKIGSLESTNSNPQFDEDQYEKKNSRAPRKSQYLGQEFSLEELMSMLDNELDESSNFDINQTFEEEPSFSPPPLPSVLPEHDLYFEPPEEIFEENTELPPSLRSDSPFFTEVRKSLGDSVSGSPQWSKHRPSNADKKPLITTRSLKASSMDDTFGAPEYQAPPPPPPPPPPLPQFQEEKFFSPVPKDLLQEVKLANRKSKYIPASSPIPQALLNEVKKKKFFSLRSSPLPNQEEKPSRRQSLTNKKAVSNILNRFLTTRPPPEDLAQRKILPSEITYQRIELTYERVKLLVDFLEQHTSLEGVFRISASARELKEFWDNVFIPGSEDFSSVKSGYVVAAALKMYLRDQPEPLLTCNLYNTFITAMNLDEAERLVEFKKCLETLPQLHQAALSALLRLSRMIAENTEKTKMTPDNLGICLGPNILRPKVDTSDTLLNAGTVSSVISFIIRNVAAFPFLEEEENKAKIDVALRRMEMEQLKSESADSSRGSEFSEDGEYIFSDPGTPQRKSSRPPTPAENARMRPISMEIKSSAEILHQRSPSVSKSRSFSIGRSFAKRKETSHAPIKEVFKPNTHHEVKQSTYFSSLSQQGSSTHVDTAPLNLPVMFAKNLKKKFEDEEIISYSLVQYVVQKEKKKMSMVVKPCYLVFAIRKFFIVDGSTYDYIGSLSYATIKEISIDISDKGLFSVEGLHQKEPFYFLAERKSSVTLILQSIEQGRNRARNEDFTVPILVAKKTSFFGDEKPKVSTSAIARKMKMDSPVVEALIKAGFTEEEIWGGTVHLKDVVKQNNLLKDLPKEQKPMVVEFIMPDLPEFNGSFKKSFYIDATKVAAKIVEIIMEKFVLKDPGRFELATLRGEIVKESCTLGEYGLGTLFNSWELKLIQKGNPSTTGFFHVEFLLPTSPEFSGMSKKTIRVDAYQPCKALLATLCSKLRVGKPHYYELVTSEQKILRDNETLSDLGLGSTCRTMQVTINERVFPVGKDIQKDTKMIFNFVRGDIFDDAWAEITNKRNKAIHDCCSEIMKVLVNETLFELEKAYTLPARIAYLSSNSRGDFLKFLFQKEKQELFKMDLYITKKLMDVTDLIVAEDVGVEEEMQPIPDAPPPPPSMPMSFPKKKTIPPPKPAKPKVDSWGLLNTELLSAVKSKGALRPADARKSVKPAVEQDMSELAQKLKKRQVNMRSNIQPEQVEYL